MSPAQRTFALLVLAQAAHSIEESVGRLWETFPPARFVSGLVAENRAVGFLSLNVLLVAFGIWCVLVPVRRQWAVAPALMWGWAIVEFINGLGHPLWALLQAGYAPGVATAPILFVLAVLLMRSLSRALPAQSTRTA